jgi:hypothetical protein
VCGGEILAIQIDKSTNFEGIRNWESSIISIVRVAVLSLHEHVKKCEVGGFVLARSVFSAGHGAGRRNHRIEKRVYTSICEEGRKLSGRVDTVVVGELSQRKELKPVILLEVAKDPKILFHHLIGDFGGTISFRVKGS